VIGQGTNAAMVIHSPLALSVSNQKINVKKITILRLVMINNLVRIKPLVMKI
jgi:hypothetical protein